MLKAWNWWPVSCQNLAVLFEFGLFFLTFTYFEGGTGYAPRHAHGVGPSITWVLETELRSSSLVASSTKTISPDPLWFS